MSRSHSGVTFVFSHLADDGNVSIGGDRRSPEWGGGGGGGGGGWEEVNGRRPNGGSKRKRAAPAGLKT